MSKAFTSEETPESATVVRPRPPLPDGVPNYVTARGLAQLREELTALCAERTPAGTADMAALARRRAELEERIASAELVLPPAQPGEAVRFGATVTLEGSDGSRRYRIVGVDEADPATGRIAFTSPLARALLGKSVGDAVVLRAPRGSERIEILAVDYERD